MNDGVRLEATTWAVRRPRRAIALAGLLLALSGLPFLRFDPTTDLAAVLATPSADALARARDVFGMDERAYVLLEADRVGREADLLALARRFEAELAGEPAIASVEYGIPISPEEFLERVSLPYGPLFDDPASLERRLSTQGVDEAIEAQARRLDLPGLGEADEAAARDPLGFGMPVVRALRAFEGGYRVRPGSPHYVSADGRALLVAVGGIQPASRAEAARAVVAAIDGAARRALAGGDPGGLTVRATGAYHLAEESERIVRADVVSGIAASSLLAAIVLGLTLRLGPGPVLALCLPTIWGTQVGLALFVAIEPAASALAFACAGLLVGLGIDFTIHLSTESFARAATGASAADSVTGAIVETRGRLALAAGTTLAAFVSFLLADQGFLRQLGLVVTLGVGGCLAGAFLVLPPILLRSIERGGRRGAPRTAGAARLAGWALENPRPVLVVTALVTLAAVLSLVQSPPELEFDLRRLHARDSAPLAVEDRIHELYGGATEPILVLLEGPDEPSIADASHRLARALEASRTAASEVASIDSIAPLVPRTGDQARSLEVLARTDSARVRSDLAAALDRAGFDPDAYEGYGERVERALAVRSALGPGELREVGLGPLVDRFVRTRDGRAHGLVLVHPRSEAATAAARADVETAIETALAGTPVTGHSTGLHVIALESAAQVAREFEEISLLTLGGIVLVLTLRFVRPGRVLAVLAPAGLAAVWTAALYARLDHRLNLMNMAVLPMVLAIGIDDGIHLFDLSVGRSREAFRRGLASTAAAVVLTSATTMVAFGSFALSRNRGLASVGVLSILGLGGALVASLLVLPAILAVTRRDWRE